ncbi:hypothetical protein LCGC14_0668750 [marine sediment metagenome]|uniref:Uncharacterized protein n=1 Tax=marine sediment metagenome TaxID=412755 RepID=A0A0F9TZQ8_9ZZZZ
MEEKTTEKPTDRLCPKCANALVQINGVTTVNINIPSDAGDNYVPMEIADSWYCARCTWHERFDGNEEPDTSWLKEKSDGQRKHRETHEQAESKQDPPPPFPDPLKALGEGLQAIGNMGMQALNMAQATMDETVRQGQELNQRMVEILETIAPVLPPQPGFDRNRPGFAPEASPKTPPTAPIFGEGSEEE